MTTRRNVLLLAGAAALLPGCRPAASPATAGTGPGTAAPDVLLADTRRGLLLLTGGQAHHLGAAAVTSPDGGSAVLTGADGTAVTWVDTANGRRSDPVRVAGRWHPRVLSTDGRVCALADTPAHPAAAPPAARDRTRLLIVTRDGAQRRFTLAGVVEPDAFTADSTGLFILQWLPAGGPDRYRVRLLDVGSGLVQPLLTRDKRTVPPGAEEEMRGEGRHAVLSPDRQVLYTLYTHQAGHRHTRDLVAGRPGGVHAFVHVLHLQQRWAYCLDLPHPFGEGPAAGHALAVGAHGRRLSVADLTSGSLGHADTASLTITRVDRLAPAGGAAAVAADRAGGRVFAGAGQRVQAVAADSGRNLGGWDLPGPVRGLGLSRDGERLYAGGTDEIVVLDPAGWSVRDRLPVPGLTGLRHVR